MKRLSYILTALLCTFLTACDMDIVPKGQSTLEKTSDLELLMNVKTIRESPFTRLGLVVNESYGGEVSTIATQISNENTTAAILLTCNESLDLAPLASKDDVYGDIYQYVHYMNVILSKIDGASGDDSRKSAIKAEAKVTRAYYLCLAANIYAKQYDAATVDGEGGIAYPETTDIDTKPQLPLKECYEKMLDDCSDENIAALLDNANANRITKAGGNAVRAFILFQMKRYDEALAYAEKAIALNGNIEDRSSIAETGQWVLLSSAENNLFYISPFYDEFSSPVWEVLSPETASLFEKGDYVKDYAYDGYFAYWDSFYGMYLTGIVGALWATGYDAYSNPWGLTVEQMMYLAAECHIRKGNVAQGLDLVNRVRKFRIHPDNYQPLAADNADDAMAQLQRAKFIECIGSFWNFVDRRRWNTEDKYRKTITRDLQASGKYSIAPESKLWVMPFPLRVMQNNPTFKQNY